MDKRAAKRQYQKAIYGPLGKKSLHSALKRELLTNFGFESMHLMADILIERFLALVNEFSQEKERFLPYQTLVIGVDKNECFGYGKGIEEVQLKVATISLITPEEIAKLAQGHPLEELRPSMVARVLKEAYSQNTVLSFSTLAILFSVDVATISRWVNKYYQQNPGELLPHAGSIFDLGRTVSHKERAIELLYQGLLTQEIARRMAHHPDRIDRYLNDHKRVVEAYKAGHKAEGISFLTKIQLSLVKEHIRLYKDFIEEKAKTDT